MRRGKTKPVHLTVIDGNRGGKPGGHRTKAKPAKVTPTPPPEHLGPHALRAWNLFEPAMRKMGVFQPPDDVLALEQACQIYEDVVELRKVVKDEGRFYTTANGMKRPHPATGQLADADRRLQSYLSEFGLTPSARAKLLQQQPPAPSAHAHRDANEAFFG